MKRLQHITLDVFSLDKKETGEDKDHKHTKKTILGHNYKLSSNKCKLSLKTIIIFCFVAENIDDGSC